MKCDLCIKDDLNLVYVVPTTKRNLSVYACKNCGLVQSFPKIDHIKKGDISISSGADWGNIRYGKAFVSEKSIKKLEKIIDFNKINNCLDIGSNRGTFVINLSKIYPNVKFVAIEPDNRIIDNYKNNPKIRIVNDRFENIKLGRKKFDLVYCSHTLEHLKSPKKNLKKIFKIMKPNGILYVEVPNLNAISNFNIVEEWFIDKHLYHFSSKILEEYLISENFEILNINPSNEINIEIIAKKSKKNNMTLSYENFEEYKKNIRLIKLYVDTLKLNQSNLIKIGTYLNKLSTNNKVTIWGAGRILDSLVRLGNLNLKLIDELTDKFLSKYVTEVHGTKLKNPDDIDWKKQQIVFIASREYFNEIKDELKEKNKNLTIIGFNEIFLDQTQKNRKLNRNCSDFN